MTDATRRGFLQLTGLGLASLAIGCRSEESEAPPGPAKGSASTEKDPPPPTNDEAPVNDAKLRPFRLDFRSAGGHVMASEGTLAIHQWMSWLRVHSDERVAELILTRHSGDLVDRPVGRFRHTLDDAALLELQRAIESTKWAELPEPLIGDPTTNMLTLDYSAGETKIQREFSASAHEFLAAIAPLMETLNASMTAPLDHPLAALVATAETSMGKGKGMKVLSLRLRNVGSEPVVITDPRVPAVGDAGPRAKLLVAQAPSGYQMPSWTEVGFLPLSVGEPEVRVLPAGGELVAFTNWKATSSGPWLLQAVWQDYAGPTRAKPDQLPFMPVGGLGPYPVRGATFSSYASFDA